jgi:hypothetical protein
MERAIAAIDQGEQPLAVKVAGIRHPRPIIKETHNGVNWD